MEVALVCCNIHISYGMLLQCHGNMHKNLQQREPALYMHTLANALTTDDHATDA